MRYILTILFVLIVSNSACAVNLSWRPPVDCDMYITATSYYKDAQGNITGESDYSNEVKSRCPDGYKLHWGTESRKYTESKDVGNVLSHELDIETGPGTLKIE